MASVTGEDMMGCGVSSPSPCPAARGGQMRAFPGSDQLDACPQFQGGDKPRCSAVCVPVARAGQTVGGLHARDTVSDPIAPGVVTLG